MNEFFSVSEKLSNQRVLAIRYQQSRRTIALTKKSRKNVGRRGLHVCHLLLSDSSAKHFTVSISYRFVRKYIAFLRKKMKKKKIIHFFQSIHFLKKKL